MVCCAGVSGHVAGCPNAPPKEGVAGSSSKDRRLKLPTREPVGATSAAPHTGLDISAAANVYYGCTFQTVHQATPSNVVARLDPLQRSPTSLVGKELSIGGSSIVGGSGAEAAMLDCQETDAAQPAATRPSWMATEDETAQVQQRAHELQQKRLNERILQKRLELEALEAQEAEQAALVELARAKVAQEALDKGQALLEELTREKVAEEALVAAAGVQSPEKPQEEESQQPDPVERQQLLQPQDGDVRDVAAPITETDSQPASKKCITADHCENCQCKLGLLLGLRGFGWKARYHSRRCVRSDGRRAVNQQHIERLQSVDEQEAARVTTQTQVTSLDAQDIPPGPSYQLRAAADEARERFEAEFTTDEKVPLDDSVPGLLHSAMARDSGARPSSVMWGSARESERSSAATSSTRSSLTRWSSACGSSASARGSNVCGQLTLEASTKNLRAQLTPVGTLLSMLPPSDPEPVEWRRASQVREKCPRGHLLRAAAMPNGSLGFCYACKERFKDGALVYTCDLCDYDECDACCPKALQTRAWKSLKQGESNGQLDLVLQQLANAHKQARTLKVGDRLQVRKGVNKDSFYKEFDFCTVTGFPLEDGEERVGTVIDESGKAWNWYSSKWNTWLEFVSEARTLKVGDRLQVRKGVNKDGFYKELDFCTVTGFPLQDGQESVGTVIDESGKVWNWYSSKWSTWLKFVSEIQPERHHPERLEVRPRKSSPSGTSSAPGVSSPEEGNVTPPRTPPTPRQCHLIAGKPMAPETARSEDSECCSDTAERKTPPQEEIRTPPTLSPVPPSLPHTGNPRHKVATEASDARALDKTATESVVTPRQSSSELQWSITASTTRIQQPSDVKPDVQTSSYEAVAWNMKPSVGTWLRLAPSYMADSFGRPTVLYMADNSAQQPVLSAEDDSEPAQTQEQAGDTTSAMASFGSAQASWQPAQPCPHCGKRPGLVLGIRGFGLREAGHEERCARRMDKRRQKELRKSGPAPQTPEPEPAVAVPLAASPAQQENAVKEPSIELSEEEEQEARLIFELVDVDCSQTVTMLEFSAVCVKNSHVAIFIGISTNPKEGGRLKRMNTDLLFEEMGDGGREIEWEEFRAFVAKRRAQMVPEIDDARGSRPSRPSMPPNVKIDLVFEMVDANQSGTITMTELAAFLVKRPEIAQIIGLVDRKEESSSSSRRRPNAEAIFKEIDVDGSKEISLSEFRAFVSKRYVSADLETAEIKGAERGVVVA